MSDPPPTNPPPDRPDAESRGVATESIARAGERAALAAGLRCHTEHSPGSESVYLHVLRAGVWYGVRVSCHEPAYDCSQDYEQLRVGWPLDAEGQPAAEQAAAERAVAGGAVVADPAEVAEAVRQIASVMADGRVYRDADGTRWRWSSEDETWRQVGRYWGEGEPTPPAHRPNPAVSARIRCQVRHARNVNAKWAAEHDAP